MNKKTLIFFVIAILIVLGLIIFLDKSDVKTNVLDEQNNSLSTQNTSNSIEAKNGENFEINLESNPTTGYSWVPEFDKNYLELANKDFVQQNTDKQVVGAGGTEKFQFKALKTGETKINFYYIREWEIDVAPIDQKVFDVIIK